MAATNVQRWQTRCVMLHVQHRKHFAGFIDADEHTSKLHSHDVTAQGIAAAPVSTNADLLV